MKKQSEKKRTLNVEIDYDNYWKEFVEEGLEEVLAFGFSDLHQAIDFNKPIESQPTELRKLAASFGKKGGVTADLLFKVYLKPGYIKKEQLQFLKKNNSNEVWLLIHFEIEISPKTGFSFRMFRYFIRALERYDKAVIAIAIFPGAKPQPHHKCFEWRCLTSKVVYQYGCLDVYEWTEEELLKSNSIVALALLASKRAYRTRGNHDLRFTYKRELLKLIKERGYPKEVARKINKFVFHVMYLPDKMDRKIVYEVFIKNDEDMTTTAKAKSEIAASKAELLFKIFIELDTGKPYEQYKKEQEEQLEQIQTLQEKIEKTEKEKQKAQEEKALLEQKAQEEKALLEQKAQEEKALLEQKAQEEKALLEQKAQEEKALLEQKAKEEKALLEQKVEEERRNLILRLAEMLIPMDIAMALNLREEDVLKVINANKNKKS